MFWSKLAREYELQRELDGYAAEIEEMIEIAAANERRAFAECQRIEWDHWRTRKRHLRSSPAGIWVMPAAAVSTGFAPCA